MNLTTADLQHFTTCPRLYWFSQGRENPYMQWFNHFDSCMHRLWTGIALQVQSGEKPTQKNVEARWGKLYYPNATKESILGRTTGAGRWHDPDRSLFFVGIVSIKQRLDEWLQAMQPTTASGQEWLIPLVTHQLQGRYDLITEENGQTILWDLRFSTTPKRKSLRIDWEITAMAAAYLRDFGKLPDRIRIYEAILGDVMETRRNESDFALLNTTATQIIDSIERKVDYPAFSYQCEQCPFYQNCYRDYTALVAPKKKG